MLVSRSVQNHQPVHTDVAAKFRVLADANSAGDIRTAIELTDQRNGQRGEIDVVTLPDNIFDGATAFHDRRPAQPDALDETLADITMIAVEADTHARARAENPAHNAKVVAAHALEPQRFVGCTHARRNMT